MRLGGSNKRYLFFVVSRDGEDVYGVATGVSVGSFFFFFQAEDGIRDSSVTGVQTCALPISREMGYAAAAAAATGAVAEGSVGAGTGASVGKLFGVPRAMRGGLGTASARVDDAVVGALVVGNAVGDVRHPGPRALIAGPPDPPQRPRLLDTARALRDG